MPTLTPCHPLMTCPSASVTGRRSTHALIDRQSLACSIKLWPLQQTQVVQIKNQTVSLDNTGVNVYLDGTRGPPKTVRRLSAHLVASGTPSTTSSRLTRHHRLYITWINARCAGRVTSSCCSNGSGHRIARCTRSWSALMKATKPARWCLT